MRRQDFLLESKSHPGASAAHVSSQLRDLLNVSRDVPDCKKIGSDKNVRGIVLTAGQCKQRPEVDRAEELPYRDWVCVFSARFACQTLKNSRRHSELGRRRHSRSKEPHSHLSNLNFENRVRIEI